MTRKLLLSVSTAFTLAFATAVTVTAFVPTSAVAQQDVLAAAFEGVGNQGRRAVQSKLKDAGLYNGGIDGQYGPGTRGAIVAAADFVHESSYQRVKPDISSAAGARAFVSEIAAGNMDKWFWGEGAECDGC